MTPTSDTPAERDDKATTLAHDLRRFKIITYVLYAVAVGLAIYVATLSGNVRDVVQQIQTERARNTLSACHVSNREHAAIRNFAKGSIPQKRMDTPAVREYLSLVKADKPIPATLVARSQVVMFLSRADATFPARNCERELAEKVKGADL